jgi:hypothetical protein
MTKRRKGSEAGLRPLKQRKTKRQLAKRAAKKKRRIERRKVVPGHGG